MKGLESALFVFIGTAAGIFSTNLNHFFKMASNFGQDPIFILSGLALAAAGKIFPKLSAKIIANIWVGAYSAYITLPATKIMTKAPMGQKESYYFYGSLVIGFIISWFLFNRAEAKR